MCNLNQTWVFYGGGVAAAMTQKWSFRTAPSGSWDRVHGVCDHAEFFEKWHYYETTYPEWRELRTSSVGWH